jgi:two-component system phosphate regulon sensor histidine kinase PhoR
MRPQIRTEAIASEMDGSTGFLTRLRRALWAAAAGLALAAVCIFVLQLDDMWSAAAGVIAAVLVALLQTPRPEAAPDAARVTALDPLPTFSPLAREVFEHLPDPLMLLDAAERVLFANAAMRAIVGAAAERKHVSAILRTPSLLAALARTASTGEPESVEFSFHVPVERTYQAYAIRVGPEPSVTALLLHDLTSLKRSEQMRVDFVANASHELRTPLAAVTGFIETLKGHARDDQPAREKFLDIMAIEAGRMRRLIDDLLSLSRIELNEHVPPQGEVALESVAREAVAALAPLARAENMSVELSAAGDLPLVAGERDELIQLFQNLIHNAIKYGKPGGHVWVTLSAAQASGRGADSVIAASVRDDGEGIPSEAIPRLTERFYRVDVKRSREKGGTGLGLAIVKHIANRHQGRLQIESRAGEGSTFTVFLPVSRAPFLASVPSVAAQ